mmetsp:Transcript_45847/g.132775  ORF Transcript_45847/g.132775 Transcript_45847/m.132775 type:complete len:498 (+) Transcript_45847:65-1558(+)
MEGTDEEADGQAANELDQDIEIAPGCKTSSEKRDALNRKVLIACICAVSMVEGIDQVSLPSVSFALQRDLGLPLADFAKLGLAQNFALSAVAPVWGVLADRQIMDRKHLLTLGAVMQGIITMILAAVDSLVPMLLLRICNGAMLASLLPIVSGIIADVAAEQDRGKIFGWSQLFCIMGMCAGVLFATPLSTHQVAGHQGWRAVFLCTGSFAVIVGAIVALAMTEPPRHSSNRASGSKSWLAEVRRLIDYLWIPSFCVLVAQGCIGGVGWVALHYQTLYFQVQGLESGAASVLQAFAYVAQAFGNLLGGIIGDAWSKKSPMHGRTLTAQVSVLSGIPIVLATFIAQPPESWRFGWYLSLVILLGLIASWACPGAIWPILSEIVAPDGRSSIMAWETAIERSVAAIIGNVSVGFLAQDVFGFSLSSAERQHKEGVGTVDQVALGKTLAFTTTLPWLICTCLYSLLHLTYPRDCKRLRALESCSASSSCVETDLSDNTQT